MRKKRTITITIEDVSDDAYAAFANGLWYFARAAVPNGDFHIAVPSADVPLLDREWSNPDTPRWTTG